MPKTLKLLGKTHTSSSFIDEVHRKLPDSQVNYFYCRYGESSKTDFIDIIRSLIAQILDLNPACSQYLYDTILSSVDCRANNLCIEIFQTHTSYHQRLFIGIDGFDE